jgi:3-isopropylmalate dehydrogenase
MVRGKSRVAHRPARGGIRHCRLKAARQPHARGDLAGDPRRRCHPVRRHRLAGIREPPEARKIDQLLRIRRNLDLFTNLRPVRTFKALAGNSTLRPEVIEGCDMMIVRELCGGIYFGMPRGSSACPTAAARAVNTTVYTSGEIERIARAAFELARVRQGRLCSVDKSNVLVESGRLWRKVVQALHDCEYPDVELTHMYVDNCAMQIMRNPRQFDVLVMENMFGDILSDCAAMVAGSLGMLPSASLGAVRADGKRHALYEPIHGSAADIAGKGVANPLGAILSFALCLQHSLGKPQEARLLERAVEAAIAKGAHRRHRFAGLGADIDPCNGRCGPRRACRHGIAGQSPSRTAQSKSPRARISLYRRFQSILRRPLPSICMSNTINGSEMADSRRASIDSTAIQGPRC